MAFSLSKRSIFIPLLASALLVGCGPRTPEELAESGLEVGIMPEPADSLSLDPRPVDEEYVALPFSRLSIVPPPGFQLAAGYPMLVRADSAMIIVMEQDGKPFYRPSWKEGIASADTLKLVAAKQQESVTVAGYPARFASFAAPNGRQTHLLAFGDSTFSVMVRATFPAHDIAAAQSIRQTMLTLRYDRTRPATPVLDRYYRVAVDGEEAGYVLTNSMGNVDQYTPNPRQVMLPEGVTLFVSQLPAANKSLADLRGEAWESAVHDGVMTRRQVRRTSSAAINGYEAYEAEYEGGKGNVTMGWYLAQLKRGNQAVHVEAICSPETFAANLSEFKRFTRSIRFKE